MIVTWMIAELKYHCLADFWYISFPMPTVAVDVKSLLYIQYLFHFIVQTFITIVL